MRIVYSTEGVVLTHIPDPGTCFFAVWLAPGAMTVDRSGQLLATLLLPGRLIVNLSVSMALVDMEYDLAGVAVGSSIALALMFVSPWLSCSYLTVG